MAYQNVGTPRFYVSVLQWLKSLGMASYSEGADFTPLGDASSLLDINPSSTITFKEGSNNTGSDDNISYKTDIPLGDVMPTENNFVMVLGHNLRSATISSLVVRDNNTNAEVCTDEVVNKISSGAYNGFTIMKGADAGDIVGDFLVFTFNGVSDVYETDIKIGSVLYGTYYDMPHSPDLSLTMTREYGGIKTIETKGGASLSNTFYTKPPAWGNLGAWELGDSNSALSRSGRRTFDLSFSYLQDSDVFGSNQSLGININDSLSGWDVYAPFVDNPSSFESSDIDNGYFNYNILTDDNFYSQVIHKTNGGQLPFIFQPDGSNNNPDQFAICKFDMKNFSFQQTAPGLYSVKMKIREVW